MAKVKKYFEPIDAKIDFVTLEKELLQRWYKDGIIEKYLSKNNKSNKYFSFLDGPITANNPMAVHHAWGRTYKDLWQRYKNMEGFKQRFQNGFDCQGLWVEVEVEKELGLESKKDIENLVPGNKKKSIEKFVDLCKKRAYKYADIQTEQSKRLGYFMDWDNSYYTMDDENNYMIWHFLKVCHENGWVYKGNDSVPWCPRCQTAISQHEILTENYKEVVHDSVYFALPIVEREGENLLVWTTTPWTLPANIAVAVDKKLDYSLVEVEGKKYWLAKDMIKKVFGNVSSKKLLTKKGEELVGLHYVWAFDNLPAVSKLVEGNNPLFHSVIETDDRIMPISTEEGTGMVHTAVSAGTEDFKLGKKLGLPIIPVIADDAAYLNNLGDFSGKNAKEDPGIILDYLQDMDKKSGTNWIYKTEKYKHRYPRCWRCKHELVWKVTEEWYIAMDKPGKDKRTMRRKMINVAKNINWIPGFGLKRELDWLNNMDNWLISKKNRYWGLALPIWECEKCKYFEIIGSKEKLKEKAAIGWKNFNGKSPHKPQIDEIKIKCPECRGKMSRIESVGNPWLDAGIVAFSTISKDNKGKPLYLSDKKEWKKWFPADYITESFPGQFKNWFYSLIAMSTVLENVEPTKLILGHATVLAEDGREMHKSRGNAIEFNEGADKIGVDVMRWMFVRQNVTDNLLFGYKIAAETRRKFHLKLWNVYNFFITYANINDWVPEKNIGKKKHINLLDRWILSRLNETTSKVTDCLDNYDAFNASDAIQLFVEDLSNWYVRRSRSRASVNNVINGDKEAFFSTLYEVLVTLTKVLAPFTPYLADVIYHNLTKESSVHLSIWPDGAIKVDKGTVSDMVLIREIAEIAHSERKRLEIPVRQPLLDIKVTIISKVPSTELTEILKDELNIKKVIWKKGSETKVVLNTKITKKLKEEADARALVRKIQNERKKLGIIFNQKVVVKNEWVPTGAKLIQYVKVATLASGLTKGKFEVRKD